MLIAPVRQVALDQENVGDLAHSGMTAMATL
jgi:hypothetical protein